MKKLTIMITIFIGIFLLLACEKINHGPKIFKYNKPRAPGLIKTPSKYLIEKQTKRIF